MSPQELQELLDLDRAAEDIFSDLASSDAVHRVIDSAPTRDSELELQMHSLGFYSALLPGEEGTMAHLARIITAAGAACATTRLLGHAVGAATALAHLPAGRVGEAVTARAAAGIACTVLGVASAQSPFSAAEHGGRLRVEGSERFVLDADGADVLITFVDGQDGPLVLVLQAPDLEVIPLHTVDRTRVLSHVSANSTVVAGESVLAAGEEAAAVRAAVVRAQSLAVCFDSVGIAARALELTVNYAKTREQFGRAIGGFQAVKHQLADMAARTELARAICEGVLADVLGGTGDHTSGIAMAHEVATRNAAWVAGRAVQLHGGIGYTWEHDAHILLKRSKLNEKLCSSPADRRAHVLASLRTEGASR